MSVFQVNKFITIKLEENKTNIYVNNKLFKQCKFLLLEIPIPEMKSFSEIESIDEVSEKLDRSLEPESGTQYLIPPEVEFWGHCSNLQVWYENNYDTRLLHSNLAFPLLEKLSEVGDPKAVMAFKEEIAKRLESGTFSVRKFLIEQNYTGYLSREENFYTLLSIEEIEKLFELERALNVEIDSHPFSTDPNTFTAENKNIIKINLSKNGLKKFPELLIKFKHLKLLNLSYNKLEQIPKSIKELKNLEILDLGENLLASLPKSIFNLKFLNKLDLRSNRFVPEEIQRILKLYNKKKQSVNVVYGYDKKLTILKKNGRTLIYRKKL